MQLPKILENLGDLPPTPQILPKLQKLLRDPNTDQNDLVQVLRVDSALTARIIRLANSAYFGGRQPAENLSEAIARLGFRDVYRVTSLAVAGDVLGTALPAYRLAPGELFERSLACATLLSRLPEAGPEPVDAETRYTIGLMHSVGKIVINRYFLERGMEVYGDDPETEMSPAEERQLLGFDHAEAGAEVLRKWNFPERICMAIAGQLDPLHASQHCALPAQLALARWALPFVRRTPRPGGPVPIFDGGEILLRSGIEADALTLALREAQHAFADACASMRAA